MIRSGRWITGAGIGAIHPASAGFEIPHRLLRTFLNVTICNPARPAVRFFI
jgi:hypothetical protein